MGFDGYSFVFGARVDIHDHQYDAIAPKNLRDLGSGISSPERNRCGASGTPAFINPPFGSRWFFADRVVETDVETTVFEVRREQFDAPYVGDRKDAAVARPRESSSKTIHSFVRDSGFEVHCSASVVLQVGEIEEDGDPRCQTVDHMTMGCCATPDDALTEEHVAAHRTGQACDHFCDFSRNSRLTRYGDDWRQTIDKGHNGGLDVSAVTGKGILSHIPRFAPRRVI